MSATAENVRNMAANKPEVGTVVLKGRIDNVRRARQKGFFIRLVLPAASEYENPSYVEIFSENRLGNSGDQVDVRCKVSGARRRYQVMDETTGERITVQTADNYLVVIE